MTSTPPLSPGFCSWSLCLVFCSASCFLFLHHPLLTCPSFPQIPHVKIGPEETPKLPYLRFASVTLYPSNEDLSLAIGSILRSFGFPTTSLICAKAECESPPSPGFSDQVSCLRAPRHEAGAAGNQTTYVFK